MRALSEGLQAHLDTGASSLCRCWQVTRRDGPVQGFTDHDRDLIFDGTVFRANTGLNAAAMQQSTGLSVDNSQAVGALSDFGLTEADISAGKYDRAEVLAWLVNWADVNQRLLQFRGTLGEIRRSGAVFEAELRGLTEALNTVQGRAYHRKCAAVLGDAACGFDLDVPGYATEVAVETVVGKGGFAFANMVDFDTGWFTAGTLRVLGGASSGVVRAIKRDRFKAGVRYLDLWQDLPEAAVAGDKIRLEAGCDKRVASCRLKFHNFLNFRGFPNIPGEDWAMSYPVSGGVNDGGSLS